MINDYQYAIIIGAAKSGTSSLCYNFKFHPQISISESKETNFFRQVLNNNDSLGYYDKYWPNNPSETIIRLESSPTYTSNNSGQIAKNIRTSLIKVKLIYILRDPIDRLESHFNFNVSRMHWNYKGNMLDPTLQIFSSYKTHILNYYQHFAKNDLLLLNFDQLKDEPGQIVQTVCKFLGIEETYQPPAYRSLAKTKNITRMDYLNWHYRMRKLGPLNRVIFNPITKEVFNLDKEYPKRKVKILGASPEAFDIDFMN